LKTSVKNIAAASVALVLCAGPAAQRVIADDSQPPVEEKDAPKTVEYGPKGLDIRSRDGNFHAHIDWRVQFRLIQSDLGDDSIGGSPEVREGEFTVNRARFKLGGHAYRPWLSYYFEYDFPSTRMLDFRFTARAVDELRLRVGQWKVPYSRERVDSSGKQQFVERSIANDWFTLDRQQGILVFGRLWEGTRADSWYNVGVFSATGRGGSGSVEQPMVLGRWQWNFLRRDLPFSQCDIGYRERPAASLAVAGASWQGPFTAFSSAGGGQLPDFEPGGEDRYGVGQVVVETAYQYRGFSLQQEYHRKTVDDTETNAITDLEGGYLQVGYFFHSVFDGFPKPLETAVRYARVDPNTAVTDDLRRELSLVFNWFFHGHRNKLSLDLSRLADQARMPGERWENRVRIQWDVSF
jgi:phosphate-selective porin